MTALEFLPLALSFLAAALIAPAALRALAHGELVHDNYRGVRLPYPAGTIIVAAGALALIPCTLTEHLADERVFRPELGLVMFYALGVAFLGLLDDVLGQEGHHGWRGHGAAMLGGGVSTGVLKAAGSCSTPWSRSPRTSAASRPATAGCGVGRWSTTRGP